MGVTVTYKGDRRHRWADLIESSRRRQPEAGPGGCAWSSSKNGGGGRPFAAAKVGLEVSAMMGRFWSHAPQGPHERQILFAFALPLRP